MLTLYSPEINVLGENTRLDNRLYLLTHNYADIICFLDLKKTARISITLTPFR